MTKPLLVDAQGLPMMRASASHARPVASYDAGDPLSSELRGWHPSLSSPDAEWLSERNDVVARVRDLVRNNGWAAGAVRRECEAVIGSQLRLNYKPAWSALGQTPEWAAEFARHVEAEWMSFNMDPGFYADAERHNTVSGLMGLAYRHYAVDGDSLAVLLWKPERLGKYNTVIQIVDPDRLSNPYDMMDEDRLRGGVELDEDGAAIAYNFRKRHPFDVNYTLQHAYTWERVDREVPHTGRPMVVHYFDKERAGQTRGQSRLTAVVEPLKMDHSLGKAELGAAILNAILAAFIESPFDPAMVEQGFATGPDLKAYQEQRLDYHQDSQLSLGGVRIKQLFPGEKFNMNAAVRPSGAFEPFEMAVLRKVSAGLGLSYEQLTNDWSKVNYSSARAALLEIWRGFTTRRTSFTQRFCTPIFAAWFEEAVDMGTIELPKGAPDFYEARAAWTRCRWIGPARGWVDPVKEAQAAMMRIEGQISTLENECAEQGGDWEEVQDQLAREKLRREQVGLGAPLVPSKMPVATDDEEEDEPPKQREERRP